MGRKMSDFKNSKTFLVILSILCAVFLWLYVENIDPTITTLNVYGIPVDFVGEDALMERGLWGTEAISESVRTSPGLPPPASTL